MTTSSLSHIHHYVPEWYQKRFLPDGSKELFRLDLKPKRVVTDSGQYFVPRTCLRRSPSRCFCTSDLYMLRFGRSETDVLERGFFGEVDRAGALSVAMLAALDAFTPELKKAFHPFLAYMGVQRFRTPRGLDWLRKISRRDRQRVLLLMTNMFQTHGTMWTECVWEIVRADDSQSKFIISDSPVTFYNPALPPSLNKYPGTEELEKVATRTIFPLGLTRCLILSHYQYVLVPKMKPLTSRTNARSFQEALFYFPDIQIGRQLIDDEVRRINFILKQASTKYIAAGREEWLYPERDRKEYGWANLDNDWFLMPSPWRVGFMKEVRWGNRNGISRSLDAHGRNWRNPHYLDPAQHRREWTSAQLAKQEWAKKRGHASRSHTLEVHDAVNDKMIDEYLSELKGRTNKA